MLSIDDLLHFYSDFGHKFRRSLHCLAASRPKAFTAIASEVWIGVSAARHPHGHTAFGEFVVCSARQFSGTDLFSQGNHYTFDVVKSCARD